MFVLFVNAETAPKASAKNTDITKSQTDAATDDESSDA